MNWYWEINGYMEIWSEKKRKIGIILNCNRVSTIVWLHQLEFYEILGEKARWELHDDGVCYLEQTLWVTPHKTAHERPLTSNLTNYPSKTNKTS